MFCISYLYMMHQCIYTLHTLTHIHKGLNPRLHGNAPRSSPLIQVIVKIKIKFYFFIFHMKFFKIQTLAYIFFFKIYSNATNEDMILKFIQ
jgi:hypothetical protein